MAPKIELQRKSSKGAFNSLIGLDGTEQVVYLPIALLMASNRQFVRMYTEDELLLLSEDIKANGILVPLIVRPLGEKYEILSGHNRRDAAELAGMVKAPCIVKHVDDGQALRILVVTNLMHRELSTGEKAKSYKLHQELGGTAAVASLTGDTKRSIQRYIRLTYLLPELLSMVDEGRITKGAGEAVSYRETNEQQLLLQYIQCHGYKITGTQGYQLKELQVFTEEALDNVFGRRQKPAYAWRPGKPTIQVLNRFFDNPQQSEEEKAKTIEAALRLYYAHQNGGEQE